MATVLITGASGFVGTALAVEMARDHAVVCMSRSRPHVDLPWVRGDFAMFEDLRQLDPYPIDVVVHLGAVTGGCLERDGMMVNVEGTRCLMRYLIDRGCRKFVMASSIAVVGLQNIAFRPLQVPIPDEHPCLDRDGYGFSKYLMEEVTRYYQRQNDFLDVINLRLSSVCTDLASAPPAVQPLKEWALAGITMMTLRDAVRAFRLAAEAAYNPGLRTLNATSPNVWANAPTAEILRHWWGQEVDLSYFDEPDNTFASVFDARKIRTELGFVATDLPGGTLQTSV